MALCQGPAPLTGPALRQIIVDCGPDVPLLCKLHRIWSVDSQENHKKIVATRCQILRLKCTKFDFGWGSAPDSAGGAYSASPAP